VSLLAIGRSRLEGLLGGSDILRRLASLSGWTLVSFAVEKGASILVIVFLARILGTMDFGRVVLAQGLVNTLQIVVVLGAGGVLARFIPGLRREGLRRVVEVVSLCAGLVLAASLVFAALALLAGRPLLLETLDLDAAAHLSLWVIGWVVLSAFSNILQTILLSLERGSAMGVTAAMLAALSIVAVPSLAYAFGLAGAVAGLALAEAARVGVLLVFYARETAGAGAPMLLAPRRSDLKLLVGFGLPVFLSSALWAPTLWFGQLIISQRAPDGLSAVGVFGFANTMLGAAILISTLTNRAALPIYASMQADGRKEDLRRLSSQIALFQLAGALAIALPCCLVAPWVMALAGNAFQPFWPVLVIMMITGVLIAGQTALGNYLLVTDRQNLILLSLLPWAFTVLTISWVLAPQGAYALAIGLFVASVLRTGMFWAWFRQSEPTVLSKGGA
jgi:O-antigen/teichoic acid export membrane protein